jgi:hypothetical protein
MQTFSIVKDHDPFEDHASGFIARSEVTMPNQLILQAAEETLSHRIVIAVALAAHTRDHAVSRQDVPVAGRRVQDALIALMDKPWS